MKIFAIGMNYAAHNQELHGTLKRPDEPVIFTSHSLFPIIWDVSTTKQRWWYVLADWERT